MARNLLKMIYVLESHHEAEHLRILKKYKLHFSKISDLEWQTIKDGLGNKK